MRHMLWAAADMSAMADGAAAEARLSFAGLNAREVPALPVLPYRRAYGEYGDHVRSCATCLHGLTGCPAGEALFDQARIGCEEQHRASELN